MGAELAPRICSKWRKKGSEGQGHRSGGCPGKGRGSPRGTELAEGAPEGHMGLAATRSPAAGIGPRAKLRGGALTRRADRSMSSRLRAGAGSPMASAGNGGLGPLTLLLGYSAAAVAASPPSGDPGGGLHRASPRERGWGGPAGGPTHRLTGAIYRPGACNPSLPTLLRRRGVAERREGGRENVTRARRVPPTPRHRHLRAGAGEIAKGARED